MTAFELMNLEGLIDSFNSQITLLNTKFDSVLKSIEIISLKQDILFDMYSLIIEFENISIYNRNEFKGDLSKIKDKYSEVKI